MRLFFVLLLLFTLACEPKYEQTSVSGDLLISNVTIIDGTRKEPLKDVDVLVKDGVIVDIYKSSKSARHTAVKVIEGKGKFLIPGLIDTHAHVTILGFRKGKGLDNKVDQKASLEALQTFLQYGITTVRNVAGPTSEAVELRKKTAANITLGPRIYTSGYAINKRTFGPFKGVKTESDVRLEVQNQIKSGVDIIKVYAALEPKLVKAAIDEAHKQDVPVVGHLQRTSWNEAAKMKIDFLTHTADWNEYYLAEKDRRSYIQNILGRLYWIEKVDINSSAYTEMLDILHENNVSVDPTLIVLHTKFWGNDPIHTKSENLKLAPKMVLNMWKSASFVEDWSDKDFKKAQGLWKKVLMMTKKIHDKGIILTSGSDFPNPWILPGLGLHQELGFLSDAGIPNSEVIKIATLNGAKALKIEKSHGSVTKGKVADLILLNSNPLEDIRNTTDIETVIKNGEVLKTKPKN